MPTQRPQLRSVASDPEPEKSVSADADKSGVRPIPTARLRPEEIIDGWLDELDPARPAARPSAVPPPIPVAAPARRDDSPVDFDAVMSGCRPQTVSTPSTGLDIPGVPGIPSAFLLRPDAPSSLMASSARPAAQPQKRIRLRTVLVSLVPRF